MPSAQEEQVNANLDLLLDNLHSSLNQDPAAQAALQTKISQIRSDYQTAAASAKSSKQYKDVCDALAKSLPSLVKGTLAASEAFKKGDYLSGAAAIMDICASVLPALASLSSALGPAGALLGALFSVVGQILSFFGPKQPSLTDKIAEMLDHVQSEDEIKSIEAFGSSVSSYTDTLTRKSAGVHSMSKPVALAGTVSIQPGSDGVSGSGTSFSQAATVGQWLTFDQDTTGTAYKVTAIANDTAMTLSTPYAGAALTSSPAQLRSRIVKKRGIAEILAMPLTTAAEADDFLVELYALGWGLGANQAKLDTPVFEYKKVAAYLNRDENQRKEGWPEVLGVWCRTYIDLLSANTMLNCLADPTTVDRLLTDTREGTTTSPLPDSVRKKCHNALVQLKAVLQALRDSWTSDNAQTLKIVRAVRPAAKERGLYVHLGFLRGGQVLYVARGDGSSAPLSWDYKSNTAWLRSISIHIAASQRDSFTPKYEVLAGTDEDPTRIVRHSLDSVTGNLSDDTEVIRARYSGGERFLDLSAMAFNEGTIGVDASTAPQTMVSLAVEENGPGRYIDFYTLDKAHKNSQVNTEPRLDAAKSVRSLYLPATTLPDDPDADAMADSNANPPGPALLSQNAVVTYAGVADRNAVHVGAWNSWAALEGPKGWTGYNGIATDPYYLWIFGKGGIACATHASMIKCRQGKIAQPTWISHEFPAPFSAPEVASLSPCADGTLLVAMQDEIYTADYEINRSKGRIMTSAWAKRGGNAKQVIKMPIPCWSVLESLRANLETNN